MMQVKSLQVAPMIKKQLIILVQHATIMLHTTIHEEFLIIQH
jgi:hypothetical protein